MSPLDDLAAAMNDHQVTDEEGQISEDNTREEAATPEQTTVDEGATAEKSAESKESPPGESKETENEPELVETASDETGKRYVPEDRFKKVYAKMKAYERQLPKKEMASQPVVEEKPLAKTDALEIELLRSTLPQFDPKPDDDGNPTNTEYSRDLDELGYSIYEGSKDRFGNYTLTRIQAARKALAMANKITSKVAAIKTEAKIVKAQQSDQGITNRVLNREGQQADPGKMSLEEKEEWLKANGYW